MAQAGYQGINELQAAEQEATKIISEARESMPLFDPSNDLNLLIHARTHAFLCSETKVDWTKPYWSQEANWVLS